MPSLIDTFSRSVTDGWGTSDSGHVWTNNGNELSASDVDGSSGIFTPSTTGKNGAQIITIDTDYITGIFKWRFSVLASGNLNRIEVHVSNYFFRIEDSSGGETRLEIHFGVGPTNLAAHTIVDDVTVSHYLRFERKKDKFNAKRWVVGDPEPFNWQISASDLRSPTSTIFQIVGSRFSSNEVTMFIDDLNLDYNTLPTASPSYNYSGRGAV